MFRIRIDKHVHFETPLTLVVIEPNRPEPPPEPGIRVFVAATFDNRFIAKAEGQKMAYTLPDDMQVAVQISYEDAKGNPASIDGDVTWTSSDPSNLQVGADSSDSTKALIVPVGSLGTYQITATADADLGAGVTELITLLDVTVVAGTAVAGVIAPTGSPEPIPTPEPT